MSEMSFEQMLEESLKTIHTGEIVEGTVISVKEDEAVLNIGYKSDGILTRNEYSNNPTDLTTVISVGDVMTVKVLKVNDGEGQVLLTYKRLLAERGNKRIEEAYNNKEVLTAKVANVLEGGLSVVVEEAREHHLYVKRAFLFLQNSSSLLKKLRNRKNYLKRLISVIQLKAA